MENPAGGGKTPEVELSSTLDLEAQPPQALTTQQEAEKLDGPPDVQTSATASERDDDDGNTEDSEDSSKGGTKRPAKKKPFAQRATIGFVDNPNDRYRTAKKRGKSLEKAAAQFQQRTGAKVFLKARYETPKEKPLLFNFGKDDFMSTKDDEPVAATAAQGVDTEVVKAAVQEGFREALDKIEKPSHPLQGPLAGQPSPQDLFASPSGPTVPATRRRSSSAVGCIVCGHDGKLIEVKGQQVEADLYMCSKTGCWAKAHNECLGFPGTSYATMAAVAPWYCNLHVGQGRPLPLDLHETAAPTASASNATKGKKTAEKSNVAGESSEPKKRGRPRKGKE